MDVRTHEFRMEAENRRELYPEIDPFYQGFLKVSELHEIYYEQSGKKDGKAVIFLHGGPGGGTSPQNRRFFDPSVYHIILMDQRGAGQSKPAAELKDNTTWHLVEDIESLREHLKIDRWVVFGGSWGATLSLAYAETHPDRVKALVLRGIFISRRKEIQWLYQDGASRLFPDAHERLKELIPEVEQGDLVHSYYRRLMGEDEDEQLKLAQAWSRWEMRTSRLYHDATLMARADDDLWAVQFARIECHYFVNGCFFTSENQLLDNVHRIQHIPCSIVQGRYDVVCPMETAWELHKRWPEAEFVVVADAGHSAKEPGTMHHLLEACDKYRYL